MNRDTLARLVAQETMLRETYFFQIELKPIELFVLAQLLAPLPGGSMPKGTAQQETVRIVQDFVTRAVQRFEEQGFKHTARLLEWPPWLAEEPTR
jgi:hypothetical protein